MSSTILSGEGDEFRRSDEIAEFEAMLKESELYTSRLANRVPLGSLILRQAVFGARDYKQAVNSPLSQQYPFEVN